MRIYMAIDLKSFYASVECADRGLNPLDTNLVVADKSRTEKTICLAVTPPLKAYGLSGRSRLFEVIQRVQTVNEIRRRKTPRQQFTGKSCFASELAENPSLELDYFTVPPQMTHYMEISAKIVEIYLRYIAPEDIHVYSIDEVFLDVTNYLKTYRCTAEALARRMIKEVLETTGITATAGIGTNLYLAKVAMDILAKHIPADENGVRIAQLDERQYREQLWSHTPLTDFWRVGPGISKKLESRHLHTMGDIAACSLTNEEMLYQLFGVNAELLIDHAWGWEPCTMEAIHSYQPEHNSISQGQVLSSPYRFEKGNLIVREMAEQLTLDLVEKRLVTNQMTLTVGYDTACVPADYAGKFEKDRYGRKTPKQAHGSVNLDGYTSSAKKITAAVTDLYTKIVDSRLQVRRMYLTANHVILEKEMPEENFRQLDFFMDADTVQRQQAQEAAEQKKERSIQTAVLDIQHRFGKNAILKGMNLTEGATTKERNEKIGGHKA